MGGCVDKIKDLEDEDKKKDGIKSMQHRIVSLHSINENKFNIARNEKYLE